MSKGSHIARMVLTTSSELGVNHGLWSISLKMRVIQVWKYSDQDTFGKVSGEINGLKGGQDLLMRNS